MSFALPPRTLTEEGFTSGRVSFHAGDCATFPPLAPPPGGIKDYIVFDESGRANVTVAFRVPQASEVHVCYNSTDPTAPAVPLGSLSMGTAGTPSLPEQPPREGALWVWVLLGVLAALCCCCWWCWWWSYRWWRTGLAHLDVRGHVGPKAAGRPNNIGSDDDDDQVRPPFRVRSLRTRAVFVFVSVPNTARTSWQRSETPNAGDA